MPREKKLIMVFRDEFVDEFVDIMCEVNPEYKKYVISEKGRKVLYVENTEYYGKCNKHYLLLA